MLNKYLLDEHNKYDVSQIIKLFGVTISVNTGIYYMKKDLHLTFFSICHRKENRLKVDEQCINVTTQVPS